MKCDAMVVLMLQPRTTIWFQRRDVFSGRRTQGWQGRGTLHLQVLSRIGHPQRDWDQDAGDQRQQRVHVHHKYTHFIFTNSRPRLLDAVSAARRRYDQNDHAVRFLEKTVFSNDLSYHSHSRSLHWLRITITDRIEYKLLSLTHKVLTTTHPPYLHNLISTRITIFIFISPKR